MFPEILWILFWSFAYVALGMFWYSPALFGNSWCKAKGFLHEDIKNKKMPKNAFIKGIINAIFITLLFRFSGILLDLSTIEQYLRFAFLVWLFATTNEISKYIWEQEKGVLVLLDSLYLIVAYVSVVTIIFYI